MSPRRPVPRGETETLDYDAATGEYAPVRPKRRWPRTQAILFALTFLSTVYRGGLSYSVALLAILLTHEMGHYLMAWRYRIPVTLPYFLPLPFSLLGTLGAVILMDRRTATRKQLFDVGVAGPLAGVAVAIPVCAVGLALSDVIVSGAAPPGFTLGDPLLFKLLVRVIVGEVPAESILLLHPIAFAGWVGLFVTALNLLPIGQLDGGHVLYGLFGKRAAPISLAALAAFALLALSRSPVWLLMVFLLIYFGHRHPPALDEEIPLDRKRKWIGVGTLVLFIVAFTPEPISLGLS